MSYIDDLIVPLSRKEVQRMFSSKQEFARIMNDKFAFFGITILYKHKRWYIRHTRIGKEIKHEFS